MINDGVSRVLSFVFLIDRLAIFACHHAFVSI